jgi:hypothetical protein
MRRTVAEYGQFMTPIMRTTAGFQSDDSGREPLEEGGHLRAAHFEQIVW